jgi:hypothetical protein
MTTETDADTPSLVEDTLDKVLTEPTEATFWQEYSPRHEFPISLVGSFLVVASLFALIALAVYYSTHQGTDKTSVPIMAVDGGFDDAGDGQEGGGGVDNPIAVGNFSPTKEDIQALPQLTPLPEVRQDIRKKILLDDPNGTIPISDEKAAAYASLSEDLRNKIIGAQKGSGGGSGNNDGSAKTGNGGTGASSARARSLRWILSFNTTDGRDYLNQLGAIGAVILVPLPPDNTRAYIFRDLKNPKQGTFVTEQEWNQLEQQIRFADIKRDNVRDVANSLGLDFTPNSFWAYFPKGFEAELSKKEQAYNNRRPEDIEETRFTVVIRGGKAEIVVQSQRVKR